LFAVIIAIDVLIRLFIIVSTHCQRHVANETGFKQDSPNLIMYPNPDLLI